MTERTSVATDATMDLSQEELGLILGALRCRVDRSSIEAPGLGFPATPSIHKLLKSTRANYC